MGPKCHHEGPCKGKAKGDETTEPRRVLLPVKEEEAAVAKECKERSQRRKMERAGKQRLPETLLQSLWGAGGADTLTSAQGK